MNKALSNSNVVSEPVKKKKSVALETKKSRAGWLFILPFVIGFALIYLPLIIDSIWLSFSIPEASHGYTTQFVGLANYRKAISDTTFPDQLWSSVKQLLFDIPTIVIFSLFMAVLLNQKMIGRAAFRAIFFVPVIMSTGIIASLDARNNFIRAQQDGSAFDQGGGDAANNSAGGVIQSADVARLFGAFNVGGDLLKLITNALNNVYELINRSGVQMLIFLAGLQSISPAIYESCSIDGATSWESFWKITFPMISPMILVNLIYTVIDSFTGNKTGGVMRVIIDAFTTSPSLSAAMAWMYFLIVIAILLVVGLLMRFVVFYQRRD